MIAILRIPSRATNGTPSCTEDAASDSGAAAITRQTFTAWCFTAWRCAAGKASINHITTSLRSAFARFEWQKITATCPISALSPSATAATGAHRGCADDCCRGRLAQLFSATCGVLAARAAALRCCRGTGRLLRVGCRTADDAALLCGTADFMIQRMKIGFFWVKQQPNRDPADRPLARNAGPGCWWLWKHVRRSEHSPACSL